MAQPIEEEGVRYVDVTDPNSGSTFRFYDVEYSIACAMDGARDVENLAEWTRAELGIEASFDELQSVISTLADLGYLEGTIPSASTPSAEATPVEGVPESMEGEVPTEAQPSSYTDEAPEPTTLEVEPVEPAEPPPEGEIEPEAQAAPEGQPEAEPEAPAPIEDIELGPPGAAAIAAAEPAASETDHGVPPAPEPGREPAAPAPVDEAEVSFAGILDEEAAEAQEATPRPIQRASKSTEPAHHLDDEDPTQVPTSAAPEDDDEDDVSVDLSAHLALDKKEVADAVRSSRVHVVPEIPRELTLEITDEDKLEEASAASSPVATFEPAAAPPASASARPVPPPPPPASNALASEVKREERSSTRPLADEPRVPPAVALPSRPPSPMSSSATLRPKPSRPIEPTRMPPPATTKAPPQRRVSVGLFLALIIIGAAVIVYIFQDQILGSGDHSSTSRPQEPVPTAPPTTPKPTGEQPAAMRPPEPPPVPAAVVRAEQGKAAAVEAKSPSAGTVAWIVADGATVEEGAPLVKLFGFTKPEQKIAEAAARGEFYAKKLEDAKAKNDTAAMEAAQKKVDEKKLLAEESQKELEKYVVKAPAAGAVKLLVAQGAAVKPEQPVASIGGAAGEVLKATFDAGAAAAGYKPEAGCVVAAKSAQDKQFPCVVESVEGGKVGVRLVAVSGSASAVAGDEVVLLPPTQ